jgi:hypothetical protein
MRPTFAIHRLGDASHELVEERRTVIRAHQIQISKIILLA